jgi:hypothetical protein
VAPRSRRPDLGALIAAAAAGGAVGGVVGVLVGGPVGAAAGAAVGSWLGRKIAEAADKRGERRRVWRAALLGGAPAALFPVGIWLVYSLVRNPYPGTDDFSADKAFDFYVSVVLPAGLAAPVLLGAVIGLLQRHLTGPMVVSAGLLGATIGAVIATLGFAVLWGDRGLSAMVGSMGAAMIGVANTTGMTIAAVLRRS